MQMQMQMQSLLIRFVILTGIFIDFLNIFNWIIIIQKY
jgi:hypothetical protein